MTQLKVTEAAVINLLALAQMHFQLKTLLIFEGEHHPLSLCWATMKNYTV